MKTKILTLITIAIMSTTVSAQNYGIEGPTLTPNSLGLVYEGAIEKNVDGQVNIHRVN